jgi:hypothetical protein
MTAWTNDELNRFGAASEPRIAAGARAGFPTTAHILE